LTGRKSGVIDSYTVSSGSFSVNGYQCGDQNPNTHIFYPKATGPFPIVTFGHGMGGDLDIGQAALETVAALGVIVVAPGTGGMDEECSSFEWQDMLLALSTAKAGGAALHPELGKVDWSRTGVWGYSMGGKTAPTAASQSGYNIQAMLAMHGARHAADVTVPSMFTTGSADTLEGPSTIEPEFLEAPALPKIYLNLYGATHTEPISPGRLNVWGGRFLACHVADRTRQCDLIYGTGAGTLCSSNDFVDCIIQKAPVATTMVV
jgi:dienelactone hydrolase